MGITLNMASEMNAYTLTDRATWLYYNRKHYLDILFEDDKRLYNHYAVIALNPKKFLHVEYEKSMIFINWLLSEEAQTIIRKFKVNGHQLFFTQ